MSTPQTAVAFAFASAESRLGPGSATSPGAWAVSEIWAGDVVHVGPNEKDWHGAARNSAMARIALQGSLDGSAVERLEKDTDEQYYGGGWP